MPSVVHQFCFCCECGFSGFFRVLPYVQEGGANFFQRNRSEKHSVQDSETIHNQTESWPWPQADQPDGQLHWGTAEPALKHLQNLLLSYWVNACSNS
jgi:hypothetical protein